MTTSHSSPSPGGLGVARASRRGSGSEPSASRQPISKPIRSSTSGVDRVAEGARRASPSAAGRGGGESASPPCVRRKSSRAPGSRRLKRQGKGSHSKARRPSLSRARLRGESEREEARRPAPETSTSRSAAGRPSMPGRHRLADRAQGALLGGGKPRRAPVSRAPGRRPMRPASDQSQSASSARKPSTRKLSR